MGALAQASTHNHTKTPALALPHLHSPVVAGNAQLLHLLLNTLHSSLWQKRAGARQGQGTAGV